MTPRWFGPHPRAGREWKVRALAVSEADCQRRRIVITGRPVSRRGGRISSAAIIRYFRPRLAVDPTSAESPAGSRPSTAASVKNYFESRRLVSLHGPLPSLPGGGAPMASPILVQRVAEGVVPGGGIGDAAGPAGRGGSEETEFYLVDLLDGFVGSERLFVESSDGSISEEPLALILLRALAAERRERARPPEAARRHLALRLGLLRRLAGPLGGGRRLLPRHGRAGLRGPGRVGARRRPR